MHASVAVRLILVSLLQVPALANAQGQDALRIDAGASLEHHSNVFKLSSGTDPTTIFGRPDRSDTIYRAVIGARLDREFSRQRVRVDARFEPTKFAAYDKFDYLGYSGGVLVDWAAGPAIYGTLGARTSQQLTSFLYLSGVGDRNLERRDVVSGSAAYRLTPDVSVFIGADQTRLANSLEFFRAADFSVMGTEIGVRSVRGAASEASLVFRHARSDYDTRQTVDYAGVALSSPVDNDYRQQALLLRLQVRPSEDTRMFGEAGYTRRRHSSLESRDFSGPTAVLGLEWRPAGALTVRADLTRDIQVPGLLSFNYVDVTEVRLLPSVALTGKTTLTGRLSHARLAYRGDPTSVGAAIREDRLSIAGAGVAWDLSRVIRLTADVRHEQRSSNIDVYRFTDRIVSVGILASF